MGFTRLLVKIVILAIWVISAPSAIFADAFIHDETGLELWIPEGWEFQSAGDLLTLGAPRNEVLILCFVSDLQIVNRVTDSLHEEISSVIVQPEVVEEGDTEEVNGLFQFQARGTGLYERDIVDWEMTYIAGARKSLITIAIGDTTNHRTAIMDFHRQIRPAQYEYEEIENAESEENSDVAP
jgi:hypothetical protein